MLDRDGQQRSATQARNQALADADHLALLHAVWTAETTPARDQQYRDLLRSILPPGDRRELSHQARWLWRTLRAAELAGLDAGQVLTDAVGERDLVGARDLAAVIDARLRYRLGFVVPRRPGPWSARRQNDAGRAPPPSGGGLLAATTLIDLHRDHAAAAHLRTAAQLARETGHAEIAAWCLETQAWQVLTAGDYRRAVDISQASQRIAPKSGSAFIQATAQEGRAWARLGDARQTRATLNRVEALVSPLPVPDRPEHHYRYDPPKAQFYVATTLSWLEDTAAEGIARQVLAAIEAPELRPRPRRAALARLDLAMALTAADKHDEAAGVALEAVTSGRLAPVDGRRAREIVLAVAERGVPEAAELAEAYRETCDEPGRPALP